VFEAHQALAMSKMQLRIEEAVESLRNDMECKVFVVSWIGHL